MQHAKGLAVAFSGPHTEDDALTGAINEVLLISKTKWAIDDEALAQQHAGKLNRQRLQFLIRCGRLGSAAAQLLEQKPSRRCGVHLGGSEKGADLWPISDEVGLPIAGVKKAHDGFKTWADAAAPEFLPIGAGWDTAIDISSDVASIGAFAAAVLGEVLRSWSTRLH